MALVCLVAEDGFVVAADDGEGVENVGVLESTRQVTGSAMSARITEVGCMARPDAQATTECSHSRYMRDCPRGKRTNKDWGFGAYQVPLAYWPLGNIRCSRTIRWRRLS